MSNSRYLLYSFVAFLIVLGGMLWSEQQAGCGKIIIPLELAANFETFKSMIAGCNIDWLLRNSVLDYVFMAAYSATLYFAIKALSEKMAPYAWVVALPAMFDAIENVLLIKFLYASEAATSLYTTYYMCVRIKFVLLLMILLLLLGVFIKNSIAKAIAK